MYIQCHYASINLHMLEASLKLSCSGTRYIYVYMYVYMCIYISHYGLYIVNNFIHRWCSVMWSCKPFLLLYLHLIIFQALYQLWLIFFMEEKSNAVTACSMFLKFLILEYRTTKVSVIPGTSVLGGVTLKVLSPNVHSALTNLFTAEGLDVPFGSVTTFYRVEFKGIILYSRQYQRVKKRNSYTVSYRDVSGSTSFALIDYFVFVHNKVIAILKPLQTIETTCKEHFKLTTSALDAVGHIVPVQIDESSVCVCFLEQILSKCLFLSFNSAVQYVVSFPCTILFD